MTALTLAAGRAGFVFARRRTPIALVFAALLVCLGLSGPELRAIVINAMADAYLEVGVFVAATLVVFYALESRFGSKVSALIHSARNWQVPLAATLGIIPGCGGAVVVVTQFLRGSLSFGSVVAVLAAGMGDAAFLLLAHAPGTTFLVLGVGWCVGVASGYAVDWLHGPSFQRPALAEAAAAASLTEASGTSHRLWIGLTAGGLLLAILQLCQVDVDALFGPVASWRPSSWLGAAGAAAALIGWAAGQDGAANPGTAGGVIERTVRTTNFIVVWVLASLLTYELIMHATGADLAAMFQVWSPLMPAVAVLVGFIPGCGPQIVVTTLYLAGAIPLSAQIANAISNDGDALFPAIALAPRAALVATLYGAAPALAAGYAWRLIFE